jgi:(4S)-4-hydroxy-5-phosphonooxypentane-2,3-dione isomerase
MLAITVRFHIEPLHEEAFLERVQRQATDTLDREPACRQFDVCRNPQNSREVFLYEIYEGEAAFTAHLTMPHFLAFDADVKAMVRDKVVEKWDTV